MADSKNFTGARETRPRSLGLRIREHRGIEGVKETSARARMGLVDAVGAVVAMAGGRSSRAHAKTGLRAMNRETNYTGRERGARGFSPRGKRGGGGSGTVVHAERRAAEPAILGAAVTSGTGDARGRKE